MMKKLVILQSVGNAIGGVWFVNSSLAKAFVEVGYEVTILNIRTKQDALTLTADSRLNMVTINETDAWEITPYHEALSYLKKLHIIKGIHMAFVTWKKRKSLQKDFIATRDFIQRGSFDIIMTSQYQTLDAVPKNCLDKTIHVQHTSFQQSFSHRGTRQKLIEYNGLVQYVWLTKASCEEAIQKGFKQCQFIYNPLRFPCVEQVNENSEKNLIVMTRFSEEKRLHLMLDIVKKVFENEQLKDWNFHIYGDGELADELKQQAGNHPQILWKGITNDPKTAFLQASIHLCTSAFEGFPLSVLEGNACGVPTVSYNFGESAQEVILDRKTGILINDDQQDEFIKTLSNLMMDASLWNAYAVHALAFAKQFQVEKIAIQWIALFDKISKEN